MIRNVALSFATRPEARGNSAPGQPRISYVVILDIEGREVARIAANPQ